MMPFYCLSPCVNRGYMTRTVLYQIGRVTSREPYYVLPMSHFIGGSCHPSNVSAFSSSISDCLRGVANWMKSNRLQLNSSKTEVMWCATRRRQHLLPASALLLVIRITYARFLSVNSWGLFVVRTRTILHVLLVGCTWTTPVLLALRVTCSLG